MFMVTEADAAAIRAAFHEKGELSAVIGLRRRFPGIADHAEARACGRTIAGWHQPPPARPCPVGLCCNLVVRSREVSGERPFHHGAC